MISPDTAYFVVGVLLLLSIVTISLCKREKEIPHSYNEFLFSGKSFFHSVASSAGSVFSVTYLLGATFIYATIYRGWTLLMASATAGISFLLVRHVVLRATSELPQDPANCGQHNLLLRFMQFRLNEANFLTFNRLLAIAFFFLLVEELAISRVVLSSVMRGFEPLASVLLFIIVVVIFSYLYIGGFKAVLNSDLVQGAVLLAFLGVLAYYVSQSGDRVTTLVSPPGIRPLDLIAAVILWTVYGVAFLTMAVDLFSRLNFGAPTKLLGRMRVRFVGISMLIVLIIVSSGIAFGLSISTDIGTLSSASGYYRSVVDIFMNTESSVVRIVFLVGLFCMIFTTIDTLLLTVMQIRSYGRGIGSRLSELSRVLVAAIGCSVLIDADAVCAFGIFVGSVLLLPFSQVLGQVFGRLPFTPAKDHKYLWLALSISVLGVVVFRVLLIESFEIHYAIPGLVLLSTATCGLVAAIFEHLSRRYREH